MNTGSRQEGKAFNEEFDSDFDLSTKHGHPSERSALRKLTNIIKNNT
jgi:hypothetical protein